MFCIFQKVLMSPSGWHPRSWTELVGRLQGDNSPAVYTHTQPQEERWKVHSLLEMILELLRKSWQKKKKKVINRFWSSHSHSQTPFLKRTHLKAIFSISLFIQPNIYWPFPVHQEPCCCWGHTNGGKAQSPSSKGPLLRMENIRKREVHAVS